MLKYSPEELEWQVNEMKATVRIFESQLDAVLKQLQRLKCNKLLTKITEQAIKDGVIQIKTIPYKDILLDESTDKPSTIPDESQSHGGVNNGN